MLFPLAIGVISMVGILILGKKYKEQRHQVLMLMMWVMATGVIECVLRLMVALSFWFYLVAKWMLCPRILLLIAATEAMSRERIRGWIIVGWAILSTAVVLLDILWMVLLHVPDIPWVVIESIDAPSDWAYFFLTLGSWLGVQVAIQIWRSSPLSTKNNARLFLIGFLFVGIAFPLFELDRVVPGAPTRVPAGCFFGLGILLFTMALVRAPQLASVLPFKVYRLMVMENGSGISLFSHTWPAGERFVDENLFSGMLQGIRCLIQESIGMGDVENIKMTSATLLVKNFEDPPISVILIASRNSSALTTALEVFSATFVTQFGPHLNMSGSVKVFDAANAIVDQIFTFVPR
jgi:hypothetical protein